MFLCKDPGKRKAASEVLHLVLKDRNAESQRRSSVFQASLKVPFGDLWRRLERARLRRHRFHERIIIVSGSD